MKSKPCPSCEGKGYDQAGVICEECSGSGERHVSAQMTGFGIGYGVRDRSAGSMYSVSSGGSRKVPRLFE